MTDYIVSYLAELVIKFPIVLHSKLKIFIFVHFWQKINLQKMRKTGQK